MVAALLSGCAATPSTVRPIAGKAEAVRSLTYTDLTDDFATLYDEGGTDAERVARIRARLGEKLPGFYEPERFQKDEAWFAARMARYLATYLAERDGIADVSARFAEMFDPAVVDFEERLDLLPTDIPVYLLVSLGEFDGGTRDYGGSVKLMFGADVMAEIHKGDARPFMQHELFHLYHAKRFAECAEVWCSLWTEGLATHVSAELNPGASDAGLGLTLPEPIRPQLMEHRAEAVCAVVARLDSTDPQDFGALFSFERVNANLPPRFGYMVGMWVAQDLGRDHDLRKLAELSGPPLRAEIEASLRRMADCP